MTDVGSILMFVCTAAVLVAMALCVVLARKPFRSALSLIVALCALAVLFVLLDASFVGAMQVMVYAGAIMVLFLFVIMMLHAGPEAYQQTRRFVFFKTAGVLAALLFLQDIIKKLPVSLPTTGSIVDGSVKHVGTILMTDYLFAFEVISFVLLVAVVGASTLSLKRSF